MSALRTSVVTGGAGFLGQALVHRLLAEGDLVRAIVLPHDPAVAELRQRAAPAERLEIIAADVTDAAAIGPAFAGVTRVFHTAALVHAWASWDRFRTVNVVGTRHVAKAALAHRVDRLVAISTSDVFGIPKGDEVFDESSPYGEWNEPYADTKIEADRWLWRFQDETGLRLCVIYPGWIYGPGDEAFFPGLADAIARGLMFFWRRHARLPWVYIDNLVDACLLASTHPAATGNGYLVHDDTDGPTIEEVCARIAEVIGAKPPRLHVPHAAALGTAWVLERLWHLLGLTSAPLLRTVDVKAFGHQWQLSTDKVRRELGWSPRVSIEEGMNAALAHLRRHRPSGPGGA